ncbi:MAG: PQQ-dependent sugar dehydrogenase [Planctomycetota bacterium]
MNSRLDEAPVRLAQVSDDRFLVTQEDDDVGQVILIENGVAAPNPILELDIVGKGETGMVGMVLDPDFDSNGFVYLKYTTAENGRHNRLSRFRFDGSTIDPDSETVLMDFGTHGEASNHNGGGMVFGDDGKLYVAVGENGVPSHSASLANRFGTIVRINADGSIPTDNPFYNSTSGLNRSIYAIGVRNPFTMTKDPLSGRIFFNNVGPGRGEEVNELIAGANYGWPEEEGDNQNPAYTDPVYSYGHGEGQHRGCAITGGTFLRPQNGNVPSEHANKYYFLDYCSGWIDALDLNTGDVEPFATDIAGQPVSITSDANGDLYYLSRTERAIMKISYQGDSQSTLQITRHPEDVTVGDGQVAQFEVRVSASASVAYQWQKRLPGGAFSNIAGQTDDTLSVTATAQDDGAEYRVQVRQGSETIFSDNATLSLIVGEPPVPVITLPSTSATYVAGDTITYAGFATDPDETGNLPNTQLTWEINFHHDDHYHPEIAPYSGADGGSFEVPVVGETSDNVWFRINLTATDSSGLSTHTFRDVYPEKSTFTVNTNVPGLDIRVDGQTKSAPYSDTGVEGVVRSIGAAETQTMDGRAYRFAGWADGGPRLREISTPTNDTTYTAIYGAALIDNGENGYTESGGGWDAGSNTGQAGSSVRVSANPSAKATWTPKLPAGRYSVRIFAVVDPTNAANAEAVVSHQGQNVLVPINLANGPSGWIDLGEFEFDGSGNESVMLRNAGDSGNLVADAVEFANPGSSELVDVSGAVTVFRLDEAAGTSGTDTATEGSVNDVATLLNGASWSADGVSGTAVQLDGVDDKIVIADSTDINGEDITQATLSFWFKADDVGDSGHQLLYKQSGNKRGLNAYLHAGRLYVGAWNDKAAWPGTFLSTDGIQSGVWHHVALVLDTNGSLVANGLTGYLDGQVFGTGEGARIDKHLGNISIGALDQGTRFHDGDSGGPTTVSPFAGYVDDVRFYRRPLSTEEVGELSGGVPAPTGPARLTIQDVQANETDSGTTPFVFSIRLDRVLSEPVVVQASTTNFGSAVVGDDYQSVSTTATIPAGQVATTVTVNVLGDTEGEADEQFEVQLRDALLGGTIDPNQLIIEDARGIGTIVNDDEGGPGNGDDGDGGGDGNGDGGGGDGGGDGGGGGDPVDAEAVTWLAFNEGSGPTGSDSATSGVPDTATLVSGASWIADGVDGSAIRFAGTTGYLSVPDSADFNGDDLSKFSLAFWFRATDVDLNRKQVLFKQSGVTRGLNVYLDGGRLYVGGWSDKAGWSGTYLSTDAIESNQWHHMVLVLDADETLGPDSIRGYLDGVAFGSGPAAVIGKHLGNVSFGGVDQGTRFHDASTRDVTGTLVYSGDIDEVRVYKQALTSEQVNDLFGGDPPVDNSPAALTVSNVSASEGDDGTQVFEFAVSLSRTLPDAVTLVVNTAEIGQAASGQDFQAITNQTFAIPAGQTTATVSVAILGDTDIESDESFELRLSDARINGVEDATQLQIEDAIGVGTILNDDSESGGGGHSDAPVASTSFLFEEASGTAVRDTATAGAADSGTLVDDATWYGDGAHSTALWFDGDKDALWLEDSSDFNLETVTQKTIAFWFNADNVDETRKQVLFKQSGLTRGLNVYLDSGRLYVGGWSDKANWAGTFLSTGQITSNHWHHVALVVDANGDLSPDAIRGYLDWQVFGTGPAAAIQKHSGDVSFGGAVQGTRFHDGDTRDSMGNTSFSGALDDVHVFDQPLTTEQLAVLAVFDPDHDHGSHDHGSHSHGAASGEPFDEDTLAELRSAQVTVATSPRAILHNDSVAMDVNDDGRVSALDALRVINALNLGSRFRAQAASTATQYVDTNGDGHVSALDALLVINEINRRATVSEVAPPNANDDDEALFAAHVDEAVRTLV